MGSEPPQAVARLFAWVNGISKCELIELKDLSLNDRIELAPDQPAPPLPAAPLTPRQVRASQRSSQVVRLVGDSVSVEGPSATSSGNCSQDDSDSELEQFCTACTSFFIKVKRKTIEPIDWGKQVLSVSDIQQKVKEYNAQINSNLYMVLNRDGSYTGFIRVLFKLTRPVSLPPPRKVSSPQEEGQLEGGLKCRTSFYLPKNTAKLLHISSRTQAREVIEALLNKFTVVDNPAKFALFERSEHQNHFPELHNFLRILQREEEEHIRQIIKRYALARDRVKEAMASVTTPG
ncbi:unnamed protein product [Coregonus sp. 'balchen']|nr:unnamed protein product [Coregonus sp. 'balchen']